VLSTCLVLTSPSAECFKKLFLLPSIESSPPLPPVFQQLCSITTRSPKTVPLRFCHLYSRKSSTNVCINLIFPNSSSCAAYHLKSGASCATGAASSHQQHPLNLQPPCRIHLTLSESIHILSKIIIMAAKQATTTRSVSNSLS